MKLLHWFWNWKWSMPLLIMLLLLAIAASETVLAQTSAFDVEAAGQSEPVPVLVREDLKRPAGRALISIVPETITEAGQNFLRSERWGFRLYRNRLHMHFYTTEGERRTLRIEHADSTPLPGTEAIAGQALAFELSWSPAGVGVFVEGELRAYLEGDFEEPGTNLVYGAAPDGAGPYSGALSVAVYESPKSYDPCENYPAWGTVQMWDANGVQTQGARLIAQPACQTVPSPDDEPAVVIEGAAQASFAWDRPTANEDGSALLATDIAGYRIFWGPESRIGRCADRPAAIDDASCYPAVIEVPGPTSASLTVAVHEDLTLYFSLITLARPVNDNDPPLFSRYSNEVARSFEITVEEPPAPTPGPPTQIDVTFTTTCETSAAGLNCTIDVQE